MATKLTYADLVRAGACAEQRAVFKKLFPKGVEVTVALCVEHASIFDWDWFASKLISDPTAWASYQDACTTAEASCQAAYATALASYKAACATAEASCQATRATALASYKAACATAEASCQAACATAWAEAWLAEHS